jgi:NAD(P)-dependent dehydrogenase (short-subunit alcohol dehydrogenase family)
VVQVEYMQLDVSSMQSVRAFVDAFRARGFRRLDILINNAGVMLNVGPDRMRHEFTSCRE